MDAARARSYLLWLLARRDYSCTEVRQKLRLKGASLEIIHQLIEEFLQKGFLDDRRRAQSLVRVACSRKKGPQYVIQKLRQKGIPSDFIIEATKSYSEQEQIEAIRSLLETRYAKYDLANPQMRQKAYLALCRQGFSSDIVIEAINQKS